MVNSRKERSEPRRADVEVIIRSTEASGRHAGFLENGGATPP
jgi:hypothetical protein